MKRFLCLGVLLLLVGCDQGTKAGAVTHLRGVEAVVLIPQLLDLRYAENHDTAFSVFTQAWGSTPSPWMLALLMGGAIVAIGVAARRRWREATRLERAAWVLIFGGAIGNLIDRIARGYVVDFVHLWHWPIFNAADVFVVAGVGLWAYAARRAPEPAPNSAPD